MAYADMRSRDLPIGSGVVEVEVEVANKTLVTVRMKRAGARWSIDGGQAVLTFRALAKCARFDCAWHLLAHTFVVPLHAPQPPERPRLSILEAIRVFQTPTGSQRPAPARRR